MRSQKPVPGSRLCTSSLPRACSTHCSAPESLRRTLYALAGTLFANVSALACANAGLSITKPNSVLSRAERGSKLNDPMNTCERSTENVLACRLEVELPITPCSLTDGPEEERLISNNWIPDSSNGRRHFA